MILRPPDFGNRFKLVSNTRIHRTMDEDLRTLQGNAPMWEGFFAHYSALSLEQLNDFRDWVNQSFGRLIRLTDFEGRTWEGIITSQDIPLFKGKEGCNYSTEFEFEGTLV